MQRLATPNILVSNGRRWTDEFVAGQEKRPRSARYAHPDIRIVLDAMSIKKCFYCESKLSGQPKEVDHFVEVAEDRGRSFEWANLYLACNNCNNKLSNIAIPVATVLDPCNHTDDVIEQHLTFDVEQILTVNNSTMGSDTIRKYRLNEEFLDLLRIKQFKIFNDLEHKIKDDMIREQRQAMTAQELATLRGFSDRDRSFSLMFKKLLQRKGYL